MASFRDLGSRIGTTLSISTLCILAGGLGGCSRNCDKEVCQFIKDARGYSRLRAALCCQQAETGGLEALNACIVDYTEFTQTLFQLIASARIACNNSNWDLLEQIYAEIRDLLRQRLGGSIIAYGSGMPGNVVEAFPEAVLLDFQLNAPVQPPTSSDMATVIVNQVDYLQQAAGDAVLWAAQELSGWQNGLFLDLSVIDNNIVVPTENNKIQKITQQWSGTLDVSSAWIPGQLTVNLQKIVVGSSLPQATANGQWCLPTDLHIAGSFAGQQMTIVLDKANPRNTIELDGLGKGFFKSAVNINVDTGIIGERLSGYGPFWMVLPVEWNVQEQHLQLDTSVPLSTDDVFPLHTIVQPNPMPGEGVSPVLCGDHNGSGHSTLYDQWDAAFQSWMNDQGCN
jgi:hypothetical protein